MKLVVAFAAPAWYRVPVVGQNGPLFERKAHMNELKLATDEVDRELTVRLRIYPGLVEQGRLSQGEADKRLLALRLALYYLQGAGAGGVVHKPTTGE